MNIQLNRAKNGWRIDFWYGQEENDSYIAVSLDEAIEIIKAHAEEGKEEE